MYDEPANRWKTCWALLAEQFLVLFCRLQFPQPSRIVPLQCRKLAMYEYHNDHDEFMIEIDPSDDGLDDSCRLITTDARIGQRWFHRMRLNARCRAVEDYYAIGEPYFELHGLVRRSRCHKRLTHELFLVTSVEKRNFEPEQVQKIRMSIALFKLLRHPALIDIKDVFESASEFFVVIPQLPGGYLFKSLRQRGQFDEAAVRLVIFPIINALIRIHHCGLYLINVRPECLLVTPYSHRLIQVQYQLLYGPPSPPLA
jgi:serine/threonine protein kinase